MKQIMHATWILGVISLVLAIWSSDYRWQYILTGVILLIVSATVAGLRSQQAGKK